MRLLNTAAAIALAGAGLMAQTPIQSYVQQFHDVKLELDNMMAALQYKEVVEKIKAILPPVTPAFEKDPDNPQIGINSYLGLNAIQSFHVYMGRALVMSGDIEGAILNFKEAEQIANQNAVDIEGVLSPLINAWTATVEQNTKDLGEAAQIKKEIEAKAKKTKAEEETLVLIEKNTAVWEENLKRAPAIIEQLNGMINGAKEDTTKFGPAIAAIATNLESENELIVSKFNGNTAAYVTSVAGTKENIDSLQTQADKIKFLNRLLVLDPQNTTAQKQLDIVLGKAEPEPEKPAPAKTTRPAPKSPAKK
ncbi:MAG: hypothetical protein LBB40_00745 [Holophagales bacterium]|jgi:hypothetical protein|nr:hypothetical protein [Holophagales bacterium]